MNLRFSRFAWIMVSLLSAGQVAADSYTIDSRHTFPSFEISHIGFSTQRGRFNQTRGKIALDSKARTGHIEVSIDANSIDTGLEELETRLRQVDFFNTAQYPNITFKSDQVEFAGDQPVAAAGEITLLGVTRPLRLTLDQFHCGVHPIAQREVCGADASGAIRRSDFGMKAFLPAVGDEVKLRIQVEGFKD